MPLQRSMAIRKKSRATAKGALSQTLQKEIEKKMKNLTITQNEFGKKQVVSGSKEALLFNLTVEQDEIYEHEFFYSYRYIFKPEMVFTGLVRQAVDIRSSIKVLNVLVVWFEDVHSDFTLNEDLFKKLVNFVVHCFTSKQRITGSKKKNIVIEDIECIDDLQSSATDFIFTILKKKPFLKTSLTYPANNIFRWVQESLYLTNKDTQIISEICNFALQYGIIVHTSRFCQQLDWSSEEQLKFATQAYLCAPPLPPPPSIPELNFITLKAQDVARQITYMDFHTFNAIPLYEFIGENRKGKNSHPYLTEFINNFNRLGEIVASEIVLNPNFRSRVQVLSKFIEVAGELAKLQNFNSVISILSGLSFGAVSRLTETWADLSPETKSLYEKLEELCSSDDNYKNMRSVLEKTEPPLIPYLGLYQKDLTFIEDGNPDKTPENQFNFIKLRMCSKILLQISKFQKIKYRIGKIFVIQNYLENAMILSEKEMYHHSKLAQPGRTREGREVSASPSSTSLSTIAGKKTSDLSVPKTPSKDLSQRRKFFSLLSIGRSTSSAGPWWRAKKVEKKREDTISEVSSSPELSLSSPSPKKKPEYVSLTNMLPVEPQRSNTVKNSRLKIIQSESDRRASFSTPQENFNIPNDVAREKRAFSTVNPPKIDRISSGNWSNFKKSSDDEAIPFYGSNSGNSNNSN